MATNFLGGDLLKIDIIKSCEVKLVSPYLKPLAIAYHRNLQIVVELLAAPESALKYALYGLALLMDLTSRKASEEFLAAANETEAEAIEAEANETAANEAETKSESVFVPEEELKQPTFAPFFQVGFEGLNKSIANGTLKADVENLIGSPHNLFNILKLHSLDVSPAVAVIATSEAARGWISTQLFSAIVFGWTSFECFATDLWINSLNEHPKHFVHHATQALSKEDQPKLLSLDQIAKHGFQIQNRMGDLLKAKFDLTSLKGIKTAYNKAFHFK